MPSCWGVLWTNNRRCTAGQAAFGMLLVNVSTIGALTPYTWPSPMLLIMWLVLPGSAIVVNVAVLVVVFPSAPVALTLAVYFMPYRNACIGTQLDPSGRGAPSTLAPVPALVTSTVADFAFRVWYVISTDAGTSMAPSLGSEIDAATLPPSLRLPPPAPFQCAVDFPQPDRASATITVRTAPRTRIPPRALGRPRTGNGQTRWGPAGGASVGGRCCQPAANCTCR